MFTSPKLWSLCLVPFAGPALVACASAPPGGEVGLADLRAALDLNPVVGHVERDASGSWLVHDETKARLARVPEAGVGGCGAQAEGRALVFQGSPGAALILTSSGAHVARYDAAKQCVVEAPFAADTLVAPVELAATRWTYDPKKPDESSPPAKLRVEAHLDLDGQPSGVDVVLTPTGVQVQPGLSRQQPAQGASIGGEPLFEWAVATANPLCGATFTSSVKRGVLPDGRTLLRYEVASEGTLEDYDGGCGNEDYTRTGKSVEVKWVALPRAGGPAVVIASAEQSSDSDGNSHDANHQIFQLPVGQLRLDSSLDEEVGSRNGGTTLTWSWTYVPPAGEEVTLYTTDY